MNTKKKIEQYLHIAPKPLAPDGLLEKLEEDITATKIKTRNSAIRRWFAPAGNSISFWRVAVAATIAIVVTLPLTYGATKIIKKYFITFEATFEYPEDDIVYKTTTSSVISGDNISSEEDARKVLEEFGKLYKEGKAKEVKPGVWVATLSNGDKFAYGGDPEWAGLPETEKKELLRKQFDEINKLRKADKYEKTYKPEHDYVIDGTKYRYFEACYTLSNGNVVTLGDSEPVKEEDNQ
jgi:hypothetical protein